MASKEQKIRRNVRRSYVISTMSVALVLFMLGVVSYVTLSMLSAASRLRDNVVVSVELAADMEVEQREALLQTIESTTMCRDVVFVSRDEKLADDAFRQQFEIDLDMLLGENPLRDSFEVSLAKECSTMESVEAFVIFVEELEGVEYVSTPPVDIVESMHTTISQFSIVLLVFLGVLLLISMLLLNNTIRLAIYSKRYLINTMKLVGATKWYIMRPFLASAFKQGVVAGVVAVAMICGVVYGTESYTVEGVKLLDYREVGVIVGVVLTIGVVITLLFSAFAVNKFVNMKSNKIHLY